MAFIDVNWEFSVYSPPITATATTYRLANAETPGVSFVFTGTGFTYDGNGVPTGGTITSVSMVVDATMLTPETVLTTLTGIDIGLGAFGARISSFLPLRNQITWLGLLGGDLVSTSSTLIRVTNNDGTFTDFIGTGLDVAVPGSFQGNVSAVARVAANGTTVLTNVTTNVTMQVAASAVFESVAGQDLFVLLSSGDTTITAINNSFAVGLDTYNPRLEDGPGNDTIIGVGGGSSVDYEYATSGVTVNLVTGQATGGGGTDTLTNILNVNGSVFADALTGNDLNNFLLGREGNDTLIGGLGSDGLEGRHGDDTMDGGDGTDTAQYGGDDAGVTVSLAIVGAQNTIGSGIDTLISIENINGSEFNDTLTGDGGANALYGNFGDDMLFGGAGADNLNGAEDNDILTPGAEADIVHGGEGDDTIRVVNAGAGAAYFGDNGVDTLSILPGGLDIGGGFTFSNLIPATLSGIERVSFAETTGNTSVGVSFSQLANAPHTIVGGAHQDVYTFFASGGGAFSLAGHTFTLQNWSLGLDFVGLTATGDFNYTLTGSDGVDLLQALGVGADTLNGGLGDDVLRGGAGNDILNGGDGFDFFTHRFDSGGVTVDLGAGTATGAAGNDTLTSVEGGEGSAFDDTLTGDGGGNRLVGLGGADTITGGAGGDLLEGRDGNDTLFGDGQNNYNGPSGADTLLGGAGDDFMRGGGGVDSFDGGDGQDRVSFFMRAATQGAVASLITQTISNDGYGNAETMVSVEGLGDGTAFADSFTGDSNANFIGGSTGDTLVGNGGDDTFQLGGAPALVDGGLGNDTISVFAGQKLIQDTNADGLAEVVFASVGVVVDLGANLIVNDGFGQSGTLSSIENVGGSELADALTGDGASNILWGFGGNDALSGGGGVDTLIGGLGDDTYTVDNSADIVTELVGEGIDTVLASANYTLAADVDNLTLTGGAALSGTGNALVNTIIGNGGANALSGLGGNDTLIGGAGADALDGGGGVDTASYAASGAGVTINLSTVTGTGTGGDAAGDTLVSVENVVGSAFNDTLTGRDFFANTLSGGDGDDVLSGGTGGADVMNGGNGIDTLDYSLSPNGVDVRLFSGAAAGGSANGDTYSSIENIIGAATKTDTLAGDANVNMIWGGGGNETITGREGADTLFGEAGNDTLLGGADSDTLIGGIGADTLGGGAQDDLADYSASDAGVTVNLQTGSGTGGHAQGDVFVSIEDVTGSEFADVIIGKNNVWDNVFDGRGGNDTYTGGLGNDVFVFRAASGADTVTDFSAAALSNNDTVQLIGFGASFDTFAEVIAAASQVGAHTVIDFGAGQTLTLQNVNLASLTSGDFIFG